MTNENILEKKIFLIKNIVLDPGSRPECSRSPREIMQEHIAFWTDQAEKGLAVLFGSVSDAQGEYGLAVVEVDDEKQIRSIVAEDPAFKAGLLQPKIQPMRAILRK